MESVIKVGRSNRVVEPGPEALIRQTAVSEEGIWAGITEVNPGLTSGWHHHPGYTTVVYVISGRFILEYLSQGSIERVEVEPGDFVVVPPGQAHNEISHATESAETVVVRYGSGAETTVELDGPPLEG